jgi:ATP-dependent helicase HrpB
LSRYNLPIEDCLDTLKQDLSERDEVVLQAPPGAGKTTVVPLALLDQPWLRDKKILMLEPRRIATRSAAFRMAGLLHEEPGQTVGYRMRLESKIGRHGRIEIITEGILSTSFMNAISTPTWRWRFASKDARCSEAKPGMEFPV